MKIYTKITKVNNYKKIEWSTDKENWETSLAKILRKEFVDQGEFYEKVFHLDRNLTLKAGWEPFDNHFEKGDCSIGWERFLRCKGKIKYSTTIKKFSFKNLFKEKFYGIRNLFHK